ncbi:putative ABC transport system ATP-binding protein [Geothermobacter ehrlichii]|uniref:Putative ABC transport system ATP-binding protein n=1 Tax=Geothermobacter ehrlichii TaxID=213224 RepID=A0A5D3WG17_9BACT|nr:ATP-binding cassette domain-containing protein [Geothermobacter ehrlichii]TYO97108.1 putative ABC transport system ATP-binding protein [Geothermobacter ehrlichii]
MIRLENVTKVYNPRRPDRVEALRGITLDIPLHGVSVLQGPSGSGKSSLLSLVGGMARPTSGRVLLEGREVSRLPERFLTDVRRQTFGFIFQQFHLVRELSARENVLLPLYPLAEGFAAMRRRADELLARFGLTDKAQHKVRWLSGGEQQRVAVARALVNRPRMVIADEPTAHLDSRLSRELLGILHDLAAEGRAVLLATHDPLVADHPMVENRFRLRDGRLVEADG